MTVCRAALQFCREVDDNCVVCCSGTKRARVIRVQMMQNNAEVLQKAAPTSWPNSAEEWLPVATCCWLTELLWTESEWGRGKQKEEKSGGTLVGEFGDFSDNLRQ